MLPLMVGRSGLILAVPVATPLLGCKGWRGNLCHLAERLLWSLEVHADEQTAKRLPNQSRESCGLRAAYLWNKGLSFAALIGNEFGRRTARKNVLHESNGVHL